MTNLDNILQSRDVILPTKVHIVKAMVFPVVFHVWLWELNHKEGRAQNCCFRIVVLEKILKNPLDYKEIKPVNPKGHQPWIFIGRTDAEAEAPILWPSDENSWLPGIDSDLGKTEGKRRSGWQRMRWLDGITNLMDMSSCKLREMVKHRKPGVLQSTGLQRVEHDWATENQQQHLGSPWSNLLSCYLIIMIGGIANWEKNMTYVTLYGTNNYLGFLVLCL